MVIARAKSRYFEFSCRLQTSSVKPTIFSNMGSIPFGTEFERMKAPAPDRFCKIGSAGARACFPARLTHYIQLGDNLPLVDELPRGHLLEHHLDGRTHRNL